MIYDINGLTFTAALSAKEISYLNSGESSCLELRGCDVHNLDEEPIYNVAVRSYSGGEGFSVEELDEGIMRKSMSREEFIVTFSDHKGSSNYRVKFGRGKYSEC